MANIDKGKLIASSFKKSVNERSSLNKTWSESYQYTYLIRGERFLGVTDDVHNFFVTLAQSIWW